MFAAFEGDTKSAALLHGHSFTAHPSGCAVASAAIQLYERNQNLCSPSTNGCDCSSNCRRLVELWEVGRLAALSQRPEVQRVMAIGTVFALELRSDQAGYGSNAAAAVVQRLRAEGVYARPLGNVVYLMLTPLSASADATMLLEKLEASLGG